ncbi:MAG TPA: tRNA (N(6)-L-threonylcarbamoyladenosine(37)-C(2))-methylthiotransferase MtaB [Syntrophomonadaceae bacterium]|nr:tRNA (N(6)-L-threonylcarbamoyladenosine(37)-C(2))-methylthiotransferase MtaB [Syntrophomonadaceae bacterium]
MSKVAFHTLGCKVNQIETEQIKEDFIAHGYEPVDFADKADIYIINTCTVTHVSDRKSRSMIRRAIRNNSNAIVAAIGCGAQVNGEKLAKIEGLDLVIGNKNKADLFKIIQNYKSNNDTQIYVEPISKEDKLRPTIFSNPHERTRAFIKIQDGCQSFCSYCIVPFARGPIRSKLSEDVLSELRQLLNLGYREIVLSGIHTGFYGKDLKNTDLVKLLESLLKNTKEYDFRIRLSSIEALEVSNNLIDLIKHESKLCKHFHVPLQSGSDKVLRDMNRRYSRKYYQELIFKIAEKVPGAALATDVMVGFPTEAEEDFIDTWELLKDLPLTHFHIFKYSKRPGTKAYNLKTLASEKEKNARSKILLDLAKQKNQDFLTNNLGREVTLLVEQKLNHQYKGLTDNYIEVEFPSETNKIGDFVNVMLENVQFESSKIRGKLICNGFTKDSV